MKEFYLSFAVKLFQNRFYLVVCFSFSWYKYSRRNTVRHIYTQLSPGVDFLCVCMYLPCHPAEFSRMYSFSNRIFQIAWLLWDNAIFPKKKDLIQRFRIQYQMIQYAILFLQGGFSLRVWMGRVLLFYMVLFYYVSGPIILLE